MKKSAYLVFSALVIIGAVAAAMVGSGSRAQNSQSTAQSPVQQSLMINNSTSTSPQAQSNGLNPQPSSNSSLPGSSDSNSQNTSPNTLFSPCDSCTPSAGHACPDFVCAYEVQ